MSKNIYVGNLSPTATTEEVRKLFEQYGEVESVYLVTDRYSHEHQSFGFVKMAKHGAREAIVALDMEEVDGQTIRVDEAISRKTSERQPRGGWGARRDSWSIDLVPY